jgi:alkylation response protein AidB-like acyl-CoA dehydrogenase
MAGAARPDAGVATTPFLEDLDRLITEVIDPAAGQVDVSGDFPHAAVEALGRSGLLGLVSATEVGGRGGDLRAATLAVQHVARSCASAAMVLCMHYVAAAVVERHGPREVREAIAAGRHLTTLALSEAGSRGQFWVPVSSARSENAHVRLDARKSWITSAGEADSYVWSSRPMVGDSPITLWLVPARSQGLTVTAPFDGLGLRGNASSPVTADGVTVGAGAMLGPDGEGADIVMGIVLPWFQLMTAGHAVGTMEAATAKTVAHVSATRFEHTGQSLADLPTVRAYVARMQVKTLQSRALLLDTLDAMENAHPDAQLKVLAVKAGAGEAVTEVTDLAMRVCGGAAFRREVGVERHFRDARAATVMAPTTDVLYDFIGRAVCGLPLFE